MNTTEKVNFTIMAEKKLSLIQLMDLALMKSIGISDVTLKIKLLVFNANKKLPRDLVQVSINMKKVIL